MSDSTPEVREPLYCDCHGDVVMGYIVNGMVIWYDQRHGQRHFKALPEGEERALFAKAGRPPIDKDSEV